MAIQVMETDMPVRLETYRQEVAQTVAAADEIDDEVRHLMRALAD